ncbi:MAG TPA: IPT/TIG domain-containing protein [Holophaga sp.]|nr:IPT/TIG domain-containing protein [Holophaga sp.]
MHGLKIVVTALTSSVIISCGGGSKGDNSQSASQFSLSISKQSIEEQTTIGFPLGGIPLDLSIKNWTAGTPLYFQLKYSTTGIESVDFSPCVDGSSVWANVAFKTAWILGAGTYQDQIIAQVTTDKDGRNQIANSPITIPVTYTLTGPAVVAYSPTFARVGDSSLTLILRGTGFASGDEVLWGGDFIPATYISATKMTLQVPVSKLASEDRSTLYLYDGVVTSEPFQFEVLPLSADPPGINPSVAIAGGQSFTITATNTTGSWSINDKIQWNSDLLETTYISENQLTAQVPASKIANIGSAYVYVVGSGISCCFVFTIEPSSGVASPMQTNSVVQSSTSKRGSILESSCEVRTVSEVRRNIAPSMAQ